MCSKYFLKRNNFIYIYGQPPCYLLIFQEKWLFDSTTTLYISIVLDLEIFKTNTKVYKRYHGYEKIAPARNIIVPSSDLQRIDS